MRRIVVWGVVVVGAYCGGQVAGPLGVWFGASMATSLLLLVKMINDLGKD